MARAKRQLSRRYRRLRCGSLLNASSMAKPEHYVADRAQLAVDEVPDTPLTRPAIARRLLHGVLAVAAIGRRSPVALEPAVQDHLHIRLAGELASQVLPEARLVPGDDEE